MCLVLIWNVIVVKTKRISSKFLVSCHWFFVPRCDVCCLFWRSRYNLTNQPVLLVSATLAHRLHVRCRAWCTARMSSPPPLPALCCLVPDLHKDLFRNNRMWSQSCCGLNGVSAAELLLHSSSALSPHVVQKSYTLFVWAALSSLSRRPLECTLAFAFRGHEIPGLFPATYRKKIQCCIFRIITWQWYRYGARLARWEIAVYWCSSRWFFCGKSNVYLRHLAQKYVTIY
jgi:hypothetical protein